MIAVQQRTDSVQQRCTGRTGCASATLGRCSIGRRSLGFVLGFETLTSRFQGHLVGLVAVISKVLFVS